MKTTSSLQANTLSHFVIVVIVPNIYGPANKAYGNDCDVTALSERHSLGPVVRSPFSFNGG